MPKKKSWNHEDDCAAYLPSKGDIERITQKLHPRYTEEEYRLITLKKQQEEDQKYRERYLEL